MGKFDYLNDDRLYFSPLGGKCENIINEVINNLNVDNVEKIKNNLYAYQYKEHTIVIKFHWWTGYDIYIDKVERRCNIYKIMKFYSKIKKLYKEKT